MLFAVLIRTYCTTVAMAVLCVLILSRTLCNVAAFAVINRVFSKKGFTAMLTPTGTEDQYNTSLSKTSAGTDDEGMYGVNITNSVGSVMYSITVTCDDCPSGVTVSDDGLSSWATALIAISVIVVVAVVVILVIYRVKRSATTKSPMDTHVLHDYDNPAEPDQKDYYMERHRFTLKNQFSEGRFAPWYKGSYVDMSSRASGAPLAVRVAEGDESRAELRDEIEALKLLRSPHPNIIELVGYSTEGKEDSSTLYVLTHYPAGGTLKDVLQRHRDKPGRVYENIYGERRKLETTDFLKFSSQIARGMDKIHSLNCLHKDLAARSVFVYADFTCKLADFASEDRVRVWLKSDEGVKPIRWMALESFNDKMTAKSNVWSFGVLLWEIITLGAVPFSQYKRPSQVMDAVKGGERLQCPRGCNTTLSSLMTRCWNVNEQKRPSGAEIINELRQFEDNLTDYDVVGEKDDKHIYQLDLEDVAIKELV